MKKKREEGKWTRGEGCGMRDVGTRRSLAMPPWIRKTQMHNRNDEVVPPICQFMWQCVGITPPGTQVVRLFNRLHVWQRLSI